MPPEKANELLADAVTERLDQAGFEQKQLHFRMSALLTRVRGLIGKIEANQLEEAAGTDGNVPLRKSESARLRDESLQILEEIDSLWNTPKGVDETMRALDALETRVASLEQLFPGEGEKS